MGHRLSKDLPLQILSVLLAVVLWVQATAVQNPIDRFTFDGVAVDYTGLSSGLIVSNPSHPAKVSLTVKCRLRVGEKLSAADFTGHVALDGGQPGTYDYPVTIVPPANVEIVEISPAVATVTIERASSVKAPVEARTVGIPADGYSLSAVTADRTEISVQGVASATKRVAKVLAELDINSATADKSGKANLVAVDSSGAAVEGVRFSPADVTVTATLVPLPPAESINVDVALTGTPAEGYSVIQISSTPARVQVRPAAGQIIAFTHILTVPVDITGATSDVRATVALVAPAGVASIVPEQVDVVVEIGASKAFTGLSVAVKNASANLHAAAGPSSVDLVLRGARAVLDRLTPGDISLWVDASGLTSGSYVAKLEVSLPEWAQGLVEVATLTPSEVTLTLER